MNISALSLSKASPEELRSGEFKLLFASAENALESKFVNALKDKQSLLHQKLGLVVIDESHVIVVGNCRFERSTSAFVWRLSISPSTAQRKNEKSSVPRLTFLAQG